MLPRITALTAALAFLFAFQVHATLFDSQFYHQRYSLASPYEKLVNNVGEGHDELYGVRNFREVLKGVLYRGGANNAYNKYGKRDNRNPLPALGLKNLCEEGFKVSVYLYSRNFDSAAPQTHCNSVRGRNTLEYVQFSPMSNPRALLEIIHGAIQDPEQGPVYAHCWNGWHASGLISALSLRQFCGVSGRDAVSYWEANVDGNNEPAYQPIKDQILAFEPYADLSINTATRRRICPSL